jgi:hypothetical protein
MAPDTAARRELRARGIIKLLPGQTRDPAGAKSGKIKAQLPQDEYAAFQIACANAGFFYSKVRKTTQFEAAVLA